MEIDMSALNSVYEAKYSAFADHVQHVVKSMEEEAGSTINSAAKAGGRDGVQALFDAVMDSGNRMVLVQALQSPSISGWVREQLEVFLYGEMKQPPALFRAAPQRVLH
jgi:ribulose kinase